MACGDPQEERTADHQLFILRGPPGCGKSTFAMSTVAKELGVDLEQMQARRSWALAHICSTDDFRAGNAGGGDGSELDREVLRESHALNEQRVDISMRLGISPLVVDNTNMQFWEMRTYVLLAKQHGYAVHVIDPASFNPEWNDTAHLMLRNAGRAESGKSVPADVVARMLGRFEAFEGCLDAILAAPRPAWAESPRRAAAVASEDEAGREEEERRVDPTDGLAYTLEDFIAEYGGSLDSPPHEWEAAAKARLLRGPRRGGRPPGSRGSGAVGREGSRSRGSGSGSRSRSRSRSLGRSAGGGRTPTRCLSPRRDRHVGGSHKLALQRVWQRAAPRPEWPRIRAVLVEEYGLDVREHGELCIVSASHDSELWSESESHRAVLRESRGTVYEKATGRAVCVPFYKFWNHGERHADSIDWETAVAEEKIDGNLMKLFHFDGKWQLASNRTLNVHEQSAKYACAGRSNFRLFEEAASNSNLDYGRLDTACCYMFERVHPDFRVVLDYPEPRLYHIGTRDMRTLGEVEVDIGVPRPRRWEVRSPAACRALLDSIPGFVEGVVVRDAGYRRQKWKRRDYVMLHAARMSLGGDEPCYAWVARCIAAGAMERDRLCLNVWLRREESEFSAYFPEARARYQVVAAILESPGFVEAALAGPGPTSAGGGAGSGRDDPRRREPGSGRFLHEERLWAELQASAGRSAEAADEGLQSTCPSVGG